MGGGGGQTIQTSVNFGNFAKEYLIFARIKRITCNFNTLFPVVSTNFRNWSIRQKLKKPRKGLFSLCLRKLEKVKKRVFFIYHLLFTCSYHFCTYIFNLNCGIS